jgi:hypothetical protein
MGEPSNTPGYAVIELIHKDGPPQEVWLSCRREPVTDDDKAHGCRLAIRRDMKETRREYGIRTWPKQYKARYVRFEPKGEVTPESTDHP